ncbi:MAG: hypothetical protein AABW65_01450 [Nanoarchaeota archaeon]
MERAICAIPAQCRKCGELFDLRYDLSEISEERMNMGLIEALSNSNVLLCWYCRQL